MVVVSLLGGGGLTRALSGFLEGLGFGQLLIGLRSLLLLLLLGRRRLFETEAAMRLC